MTLRDFYLRYNRCCNSHDFARLQEFVSEEVRVNGQPQGRSDYVAGLRDVVRAFPDYRWQIEHLVVEPPMIAAHFIDSGTHSGQFLGVPPTGRPITAQEFAVYRVEAGRIAEVWVTADNLHLRSQLS